MIQDPAPAVVVDPSLSPSSSAFDALEPSVSSVGLRNRMEAGGSASCDGAPTASLCKEDALAATPGSAAPPEEMPDLSGERGCFALLIVLYALQGSLLGLASGTLPFIIQVERISAKQ